MPDDPAIKELPAHLEHIRQAANMQVGKRMQKPPTPRYPSPLRELHTSCLGAVFIVHGRCPLMSDSIAMWV